jgi:uncharacterized protein (TIGR02246 family)
MEIRILVLLLCALVAPALADPASDGRTHAEAFARVFNAGDVQGVMALYADDAVVVWPGQGETAKGRAEIEKLVANAFKGMRGQQLSIRSIDAIPIDDTHMVTVGRWDSSFTDPAGKRRTSDVRTTEVLVKTATGWRYLVDHASIGVPPPPAAHRARPRR